MRRGEWVGGATRTRKLRLGSCETRDPGTLNRNEKLFFSDRKFSVQAMLSQREDCVYQKFIPSFDSTLLIIGGRLVEET